MEKKNKWVPVNLADMFLTSAEMYAEREALKYKVGHHYESLSYFRLKDEVIKFALALKKLGLKGGDRAILVSENRPEWVITDLALQMLGAVNVPIHEVLSPKQLAGIFEEIKPKAIFFSNDEVADKLLEIAEDTAKIKHLISFNKLEKGFNKLVYFKELIDQIEPTEKEIAELIESALQVKPEDPASIIYTSGTTGHLKGVQLTHENFVQDMLGILGNIWIYPEDKFFSVLPLSHVFERTAGYYIPIYSGASIGYCLSLDTLSQEIKERKPTIVLAVPRLFEKIYEKVNTKVSQNIFTKMIFVLAFKIKTEHRDRGLAKTFDNLVFAKIRDEFGGNIRFFVSGGASFPEKIGHFFEKVGLLVLEGYGLTETSPVIAVNKLDAYRFGTVGVVLDNIDVKISHGEVLVKGPIVMKGYLRDDDNQDAFTADGWYKTGDLGEFDKSGFLKITGRKKDLLVLTTGKKVAPVPIEEALESSPYIEQAFVFGDGRKHIGALIVPDYAALGEKFSLKGKEKIRKNPEVMEFLQQEALEKTKKLSTIEHVRKFEILAEPFSIKNGELTPKLSLRRHIILDNYKEAVEKVYS